MKKYRNEEREKIYDALRTIKQVCHNAVECELCPLYSDEHHYCVVGNVNPCDFKIGSAEIWRAVF